MRWSDSLTTNSRFVEAAETVSPPGDAPMHAHYLRPRPLQHSAASTARPAW